MQDTADYNAAATAAQWQVHRERIVLQALPHLSQMKKDPTFPFRN